MKAKYRSHNRSDRFPIRKNTKVAVLCGVVGVLAVALFLIIIWPEADNVPTKHPPKKSTPTSLTQSQPATPKYKQDLKTFEPAPRLEDSPQKRALLYRWIAGTRLSYDFRFDQDIFLKENPEFSKEMEAQGIGMMFDRVNAQMAIRSSGTLTVRVYKTTENKCTLGFCFAPVRLVMEVTGTEAPFNQVSEMARRLETETIVEISPQGKILRVFLDSNLGAEEKNFLKAWISQLQFVLPAQAADHWQETESDTTGVYLADYKLLGTCTTGGRQLTVINKQKYYKQLYLSTQSGQTSLDQDSVSVSQYGQFEGGFDNEEGCLVSLAGQQDIEVTGGKTMLPVVIRTSFTTEVHLRDKVDEHTDIAQRWANIEPKLSSMAVATDFSPELQHGMGDAMRTIEVGEATFESVLLELLAADQRGQWVEESARIFLLLVMLFQKNEENVQKALHILLGGQFSERVLQTLADALAECGMSSAEAGLRMIVSDLGIPVERKLIALISMSSLKNPSIQTEDILRNLACGQMGEDVRLSTAAISSLGWIASNFTDLERRDKLAGFLEELAQSTLVDEKELLNALGNAGAPRSLQFIARHIRSHDEETRATAAMALRKIGLPEATDLLVTTLRQDESAYVRRSAIAALRDRDGEPIRQAISYSLQNDQDDSVRVEALRYFIDRMLLDEYARNMVEHARFDPSEAVRDLATHALK